LQPCFEHSGSIAIADYAVTEAQFDPSADLYFTGKAAISPRPTLAFARLHRGFHEPKMPEKMVSKQALALKENASQPSASLAATKGTIIQHRQWK
jgi:hypothetical protein